MKCIRCNTENVNTTNYCVECGAPLRFRRSTDRYRKRKIAMIIGLLLFWAAGFSYFFRDILFSQPAAIVSDSSSTNEDTETRREALRQELAAKMEAARDERGQTETSSSEETSASAAAEIAPTPVDNATEEKAISSGWIVILDPWARELARLRAAASGNGWIALPSRACLGGTQWQYISDRGQRYQLGGGFWSPGDEIGVWRIDGQNDGLDSPPLAAWDETKPVSWLSLESNSQRDDILLSAVARRRSYSRCPLPRGMTEYGVFVQDSSIVGWSFGPWLEAGYLWTGAGGDGLDYETYVEDFYAITFAGGREEQFASAVSDENLQPIEKITMLAEAFLLNRKLAPVNTPHYLRQDTIIQQMRVLIGSLRYSGYGNFLIDLFTPEILYAIADIGVFMDIVPIIDDIYGPGEAINAIETTGTSIVQKSGLNAPAMNDMHVRLYQEWLQALVDNGNVEEGWNVFNKARRYYADNPYLHLLHVELELLGGNWREAERLLYMFHYPPELLDRYELLARRITDMKGQEGRIVIEFTPGANRIPVAATINGALVQDFLVDTGASMVTIPSSTVDALGLEIVKGYHSDSRIVSTAGGVTSASEVVISSIEIGGWVEYNVKALMLDIPDQPGLGLLGLNYLSRFKMDLNSDAGNLLLTPR